MEDQLGAEDLRKLDRKRPSWAGVGITLLILLIGAFAYGLGYMTRDNRPTPTRIITRYQLPRVCLSAINDANQAFDEIENLAVATQSGADADAQTFAENYRGANRAYQRDLVACDKQHGIRLNHTG